LVVMLGRHFPDTSVVPVAITGGLLLPQSPLTAAFRDRLAAAFTPARLVSERMDPARRALMLAAAFAWPGPSVTRVAHAAPAALWYVGHPHVRDQVRDARAHVRGAKPGRLGEREGRQVPAVAPPHHAEPVAVRDAALHQRVDAGHRVPKVAAAPVADVRIPEFAAVAAASADVRAEYREAGGREGGDRV